MKKSLKNISDIPRQDIIDKNQQSQLKGGGDIVVEDIVDGT